MKQNIHPIVKVTYDPAFQIRLKVYGGNLYAIELDNTPFTVTFDDKSLDEFQPKKTIQEVMSGFKEGMEHTLNMLENAVEQNIHPYWRVDKIIEAHFNEDNVYVEKCILKDQTVQLTKAQRKYYQKEIERLKSQIAKEFTFVQYTLPVE